MLVGKTSVLVTDSRSGKTFADCTYGDRQGRSGKHFPDRLSVVVNSFPNQFCCQEFRAVV